MRLSRKTIREKETPPKPEKLGCHLPLHLVISPRAPARDTSRLFLQT